MCEITKNSIEFIASVSYQFFSVIRFLISFTISSEELIIWKLYYYYMN